MKYSKDLINLLIKNSSLTLNEIKNLYFCKSKSVNVANMSKTDELNNIFMILMAQTISKEYNYRVLQNFDNFGNCFQEIFENDIDKQKLNNICISIVRYLLENGYAYPSFETNSELVLIKSRQAMLGVRAGVYGSWACYRDEHEEKIIDRILNKESYVIRFRAERSNDFISYGSCVHMPDDIILINKNKSPTKFFKELILNLLHNTVISICQDINDEQELITKQILRCLKCNYCNNIQINKLKFINNDFNEKDFCQLEYYINNGYPIDLLKDFLLSIIHKNYSIIKQKDLIETLSGKLKTANIFVFDVNSFIKFSVEYFSNLNAKEEMNKINNWAYSCQRDLYQTLIKDLPLTNKYLQSICSFIKKRKDITNYREMFFKYGYVFNEIFQNLNYIDNRYIERNLNDNIIKTLKHNLNYSFCIIEENDGLNKFADKVIAEYELCNKDIHIRRMVKRDVFYLLRIILTKNCTGPDLKDLMLMFGRSEVCRRLEVFCDYFKVGL